MPETIAAAIANVAAEYFGADAITVFLNVQSVFTLQTLGVISGVAAAYPAAEQLRTSTASSKT